MKNVGTGGTEHKDFQIWDQTNHPISAKYWIKELFRSYNTKQMKGYYSTIFINFNKKCRLGRNFNKMMLKMS